MPSHSDHTPERANTVAEPDAPYKSEEHGHGSKSSISEGALQDTVGQGLTYFERRAALINKTVLTNPIIELDKLGFGRYQQCIWMLCGFGYFLDLTWSQGVGLMASAIFQEMDVPAGKQGLVFTCANVGLAIGAISFGIITDIIGRKWAFYLTCLITSVFGMLLAASKYNYGAICGIYFLSSIGLGGNIPIDATIALEFMPPSRRYLVSLLSMWQSIGVVVASAIAYGTTAKYRCDATLPACDTGRTPFCSVSSNMGWRYMVIIIGAMTLFIFFARYLVFPFHESPKFLVSKGRDQDAIDVLHKIAKFNKAPEPTLTFQDFREIDCDMGIDPTEQAAEASDGKRVIMRIFKSLGFLRALFLNKLGCFTFILLALAYMGNYWSFNLAGPFLPIILLHNNVDDGANTVSATYREVIGAIIALFSVQMPLLGRKWSLVISAALQGLSMAMYTQVKSTAGYVGLNALEYIMQTYFNAVLYTSAPEMFETTYRASASGMLSCLGRIAGIVAPIAGQKYIGQGSSGVLWLGAGGIWFSALLMVFLPIEMRNRQMY